MKTYTGWGKSNFIVVCETEFILVLLFIIYCIVFHMNDKPTFAPPCKTGNAGTSDNFM